MRSLAIDDFAGTECQIHPHTIEDYETETPRWCKGCGDHGVLLALQQLLRDEQVDPERVVAVSGIGCSSRLPHYLRTYGFHGIHGRAFPLSVGVKLARPELSVLTVMGDGDCFSIGAGHWLHTVRYNPDITVLVLDNGVYALTKKQASPTSPLGQVTNTSPFGTYLRPLNPLSLIMGISNVSFLAQTATWFPEHMDQTIRRAWAHRGLSFVRILQRCPVYMPDLFGVGGRVGVVFLEGEEGIPVNRELIRGANVLQHEVRNLIKAQRAALMQDPEPMGLIYWNPDVPTYEDERYAHVDPTDNASLVSKLNALLDTYAVQR